MPPELKTLSLDIDLTMSLDTPNVQRFKLLASGYAQQIGSFVTPFFADKRPDLENPFEPREESSVYESTHLLLHPSIDKVKRMISVPLYVPYPLIPSFSSYRAVKEADSNECKLQWTRGKRSIECESLGIRLGALGSNLPMEDDMVVACLESIDSLLVAVLDGHGGRQVVDYVHYLFPRLLKDRLMGWLSPSGEALLASLDQRPFSFRNKTDIAAIMVGTLLEIESRLLHSIQKKQTPLSGASFESKNAAN
jgi:serine/threonine protein phosphatase PrpC